MRKSTRSGRQTGDRQGGAAQRRSSVAPGKRPLRQGRIVPSSAAPAGGSPLAGPLSSAAGQAGNPLDPGMQAQAEESLGVDLSGVRVHNGAPAHAAADSLSAHAFAHGNDIYFRDGAYQPGTEHGDHLLAHELVHVAQQSASPPAGGGADAAPQRAALDVSQRSDPAEHEADRGADAILSGQPFDATARPAALSRRESISGNPAELTDSKGNPTTTHASPTVADASNHKAPKAPAVQAHAANVFVVHGARAPLHLEPAGCPVTKAIYAEAEPVSPPPPGFSQITQIQGTVEQPNVTEEMSPGLYRGGHPTPGDVQQGGIGDCYFEATLMSLAARDPGKIKSMMKSDGKGGAVVTLWRRQTHHATAVEIIAHDAPKFDYIPVEVHVSDQLAFNLNKGKKAGIHGDQLRAAPTPRASDWWAQVNGSTLEIHRKDVFEAARWAPLLEKAFAQFAQKYGQYGGARSGNKAGGSGYADINGGLPQDTLAFLYGPEADKKTINVSNTTWAPGANLMAQNKMVVNQLCDLAGGLAGTGPGGSKAAIVTAYTQEGDMVNRLGQALPAAIADPDFAKLPAHRQAAMTAVLTAFTVWNVLPPDTGKVKAKANAYAALGTACGKAVTPGPINAAALKKLQRINPGSIQFGRDRHGPPRDDRDVLQVLGQALVANPSPRTEVEVVGRSSSDGAVKHNLDLSQRRADSVAAAIRSGGAFEPPHSLKVSAKGEEGAGPGPEWRRADITVRAAEGGNSLLDGIRSPAIRAAVDLMLDLRNMGTDHNYGQRNLYGNHAYSVVSVSFVSKSGMPVPLQTIPAAFRTALFSQVDVTRSSVQVRNPHHGNEPDRRGDNTPAKAGDGTPGGAGSDGLFRLSLDEFFRNFSYLSSGVFPAS